MVHSVSGLMRGVQVKLWDPLRMRVIPEHLRGVFTTRHYIQIQVYIYLYLTQRKTIIMLHYISYSVTLGWHTTGGCHHKFVERDVSCQLLARGVCVYRVFAKCVWWRCTGCKPVCCVDDDDGEDVSSDASVKRVSWHLWWSVCLSVCWTYNTARLCVCHQIGLLQGGQ